MLQAVEIESLYPEPSTPREVPRNEDLGNFTF